MFVTHCSVRDADGFGEWDRTDWSKLDTGVDTRGTDIDTVCLLVTDMAMRLIIALII